MTTPQEWYAALPPVTKVWLTSAVVSALATRLHLLSPYLLLLDWSRVFPQLQLWRIPASALFFGGPSFPWLITMFMVTRFVAAYEDNPYPSGGGTHRGNLADVLWMLTFGLVALLPVSYALSLPLLSHSLFFMVIYVWTRRNPAEPTTFYMFRVPAQYLPWVMVGFTFILGEDPVKDLLGIAVGHLYYFLQEEAPSMEGWFRGRKLLNTPALFYSLLQLPPTHAAAAHVRLEAGGARGAAPVGGHAWGAGRRLQD